MSFLRERGMGASVLVAALSSAFGVTLLATTAFLGFLAKSTMGEGGTLTMMVGILSGIFIIIAMYVGAIVTANTFSTIVAGRTRQIALLRLIGSTASAERRRISSQGLIVGFIGAVIGLVIGVVIAYVGTGIAGRLLGTPAYDGAFEPWMALPAIAVVITTWLAAWGGSRRVLSVTPLQALGGSVARNHEEARGGRARAGFAILLGLGGVLLLIIGLMISLFSPLAVVVAFFGGLLSFTAIVLGSTRIMPPVLRLVGRMFGGSATSRMAAENALRYPERSSRMSIGVVVGVTLVVMFAVATSTLERVLVEGLTADDMDAAGVSEFLNVFGSIMMSLVGFSTIIAAVGLVNLLTIGVVQRRTELGLLRALGLSTKQIRQMVLLEAAHITIASTLLGLALGVVYGWIGAQATVGSLAEGGGITMPGIPWAPVTIVVVAMAALTLIAAVTPTRLATRISPVEALAAN